jgi:hypothetical protein
MMMKELIFPSKLLIIGNNNFSLIQKQITLPINFQNQGYIL